MNTTFRNTAREYYMSAERVADAIIALLELPEDVACHELVLQPMIEENF